MYNQVFTEKNIVKLGKGSVYSMEIFLKTLTSIINGNDPQLNEEIKNNNKKSIEIIYDEFQNAKNKLFKVLKNKLIKKNLEINYNNYIENYYNKKSSDYKKEYSLKKFKEEVCDKIYDNFENNDDEIINNVANHGFNFFIMEILKNGLKIQFKSKEQYILREIYVQLFKD